MAGGGHLSYPFVRKEAVVALTTILPGSANVVTSADHLRSVVRAYMEEPSFAFDIETMGENRSNPLISHVVWLSLSNQCRSDVIPMGHPHGVLFSSRPAPNKKGRDRMERGVLYEDLNPKYDFSSIETEEVWGPAPEQLDRFEAMKILEPLFTAEHILKIGHNIKFDIHGMDKYFAGGVQGPFFDTMIASWLFDSRRVKGKMLGMGGLSLADCVKREYGKTLAKGVGKFIEKHSFEEVAEYSMLDAQWTYDLYVALERKFNPTLRWLMDLEMNTLLPVLDMERTGTRIDKDVLQKIHDELLVEIKDLESRMFKKVGREFNPRSNTDKQEILFKPKSEGGQGIRSAKLTPAGQDKAVAGEAIDIYMKSVDTEVLEANRKNPVVAMLLEHGSKAKLHGTYVIPYLGGTSTGSRKYKPSQLRDGRIFGQFKQSGTESGRFSSSKPNLQNIPSRTAEGMKIRSAFVANWDEVLMAADYSQIEPRIIASLSGDPTMIETYRDGGDVYQTVADRMGVSRNTGKTLVLAIAYGVGPTKISADLGCSMAEARSLMNYFKKLFPKIQKHKIRVIEEARKNQYSETIFGRRRVLTDIRSRDEARRAMAERQAYNHLIQGSAADIMKIALSNIHSMLPEEVSMLMTVHDEVVLSVPLDLVGEVEDLVKSEMSAASPRRSIVVPMVADVKIGHSWDQCK